MLDPQIKADNLKKFSKQELGEYYDDVVREIDEYVYGGSGADRKDFMFDAMSMIAWKNALDIIEVPSTPFQPIGKVRSAVIEHRKTREIGKLCREVMDAQLKAGQAVFVRTDVGVADDTTTQFHDNRYPGLKRGLVRQERVNIDEDLKIAQYMSPNPEYLFHVQFVYHNVLYHSYLVEDSVIVSGSTEHRPFIQNIIDKFESLHIRPRHPQYIEHGTKDLAFRMTVVESPTGLEVFNATGYDIRAGIPMYSVNKL